MHSDLLQRWVTIRGKGPAVVSVTQDDEDWLDVAECADAAFWIDVRHATVGAGSIYLYLETAPSKDEALFLPVAPTVQLAASATPVVTRTTRGAVALAPLGRWVRWRLSAPSASDVWAVTFRIRVAKSHAAFFSPSQLSGCVLWLRSDIGVTLSLISVNNANGWKDQSGAGNDATVPSGTVPYSPSGGVNGYPTLGSVANTKVFTGAFASSFGTKHTLFNVNAYTAGSTEGAFAATGSGFNTDTGFAQYILSGPNTLVGEVSNTASNIALAETTTLPSGLSSAAILSTAANNASIDLYVNGTSVATTAVGFAPKFPSNYVVLAQAYPSGVATNPLANVAYEFIVYNRVLSAAERVVVHRYLGGRYGISVP